MVVAIGGGLKSDEGSPPRVQIVKRRAIIDLTTVHGQLQPQRSYQCVANLLEENRISNGGGIGMMEKERRVSHWNSHSIEEIQQQKLLLRVLLHCKVICIMRTNAMAHIRILTWATRLCSASFEFAMRV
ncbi:hypothetical protein EVAR_35423_1 [Eumeta japonica]|uniref:Uncharacterized protein n=1 Tax=Eumeta variegata TaxID=151549 RepID=A0A4C1XAR3_EUMVA|nr:hypothetical protein EVAR_35423_1 [Eumeta japonica]